MDAFAIHMVSRRASLHTQDPERTAVATPLTGSALLGSRLTSDTGPEFEEVGRCSPPYDDT
jgi:hypothetical protein